MADSLPYQSPSLAQATNTRLDTACRHMQQCRVSTDDMMRFCANRDEELQRNKYRYCVHKDELVVGVGRAWDASAKKRSGNAAYPRVISNLGALSDSEDTKVAFDMIRYMNHFARNPEDRRRIVQFFKSPRRQSLTGKDVLFKDGANTQQFLQILSDFYPVGFSTTLGYAHPHSGDTMTSVMIGGLRTVMNGDFEVFSGDVLQFYWPFERQDFEADGRRKPYDPAVWTSNMAHNLNPCQASAGDKRAWQIPGDASERKAYNDLSYGQKAPQEKIVALIKPYVPDDEYPRMYDWLRVFAIAISSARPHEMCDIKISRQSL